jgi:hypothetical protein
LRFIACLRGQSAVISPVGIDAVGAQLTDRDGTARDNRTCRATLSASSLPTRSRKMVAPSRGIKAIHPGEVRAPSAMWLLRCRRLSSRSLQQQLNHITPMWMRLTPGAHPADKPSSVLERRPCNSSTTGRLDRPCERQFEIVCPCHRPIVADPRR